VRHELGHYLGALADEYEPCLPWDGEWPASPNVTTETERELVPWADLIDDDTPIPTFRHLNCNGIQAGDCGWDLNGMDNFCVDTEGTPVDQSYWDAHHESVGLWEGGQYEHTDIFRPTEHCIMRSLDSGFCPVCSRELIRWIDYYAPACEPSEEICDEQDNDCDGETDEDSVCDPVVEDVDAGGGEADVGSYDIAAPEPDVQSEDIFTSTDVGGEEPKDQNSSGCHVGGATPPITFLPFLLLFVAALLRRRAR